MVSPIMRPQPALLTARDIAKSFGRTVANAGVSLSVGRGEIVGLVGENGAGKSTLLSILAGFLQPDAGTLAIDGQPVTFTSPSQSLAAGVGLVHQHLSLVPSFTVREQLRLAGWRSNSLPALLASDFHGDEVIEHLSMGRRQRVEIARTLIGKPAILLLDEPTSILAPTEIGALFEVLDTLRKDGVAIVIVTHKVREVMSVADRIVAMAGGEITGAFERNDGDWVPGVEREILQRMFAWSGQSGLPVDAAPGASKRGDISNNAQPPPMLRLTGVRARSRDGSRALRDVGFDLIPGQLHAIVGVDGQGQTELAEAIAGYRVSQGTIALDGREIQGLAARERAELGLGLLVDDRLGEAAVGALSIAENLVLKRPRPRTLARHGFLRRRAVRNHARNLIEGWAIHPPDSDARFGALSGGNMQRVLAARELDREPRLLIALNPAQGLDVRTAEFLWTQLRSIRQRGGAVLVLTTDLDEALARADRCGVIFDGLVSPLKAVEDVDEREYGSMMVNGW